MKKICYLLFFFLLFVFAPGQNEYKNISDLDDLNTHTTNDTFAFIYNDTIHIAGAESLYIYIPVRYSCGAMFFHGTATGDDTLINTTYKDTSAYSGGDTIYFEIGINTGLEKYKANEPVTFYAMDSVKIDTLTGSFAFWPMTNSSLVTRAGQYFALLIRGTAGNYGKVYMIVEYINAYLKRY